MYRNLIDTKGIKTLHDCHELFLKKCKKKPPPDQPTSNSYTNVFDYLADKKKSDSNNKQSRENELNYYLDICPIIHKYYNKRESTTSTPHDLYNNYRDKIDSANICIESNAVIDENSRKCDNCDDERCMVLHETESTLQCLNCGQSIYSPTLQSLPSFKMTRTTRPTLTVYRRINHFNDWIAQFQAKESVSVPETIYRQIINELIKNKISKKKITAAKLRKVLRKLGLNRYYEHIPRIQHRIQETTPPSIDRQTEDKMRIMFRLIQKPFAKHSPTCRKNFLSYSFVLRKFVGLLGLVHLKKSFPLLKSRSKLYAQDLIWKKICSDLGWRYESSM